MARILIVEDDPAMLRVMHLVLKKAGYEVLTAQDAFRGLEILESNDMPDLIISDLMMPGMDGFTFLQKVREMPAGQRPGFLFVSAYTERSNVQQARLLGADDFIFKPFSSQELALAVRTRLKRREMLANMHSHDAMLDIIAFLAEVINSRDYLARGRSHRIRSLAERFARHLGLDETESGYLLFAALLHDIGMVAIPRGIINSPRPLTPDERKMVQQHPVTGAEMLEKMPLLRPIAPLVRHHHERWDGSGYPDGLAGEDIPRLARIINLLEAFDAMQNDRPYRLALSQERILQELRANAGAQFDPDLVALFLEMDPFKEVPIS